MKKSISGIQQMGIGIPNVHEAWTWYRENFGMDVPVFEEAATADLMLPYTGGKPHDRHAILALNLQGGGGFEIWQYTSRTPQPSDFKASLGDLGLYICKIKSPNVAKAFQEFDAEFKISSQVESTPNGLKHFFVNDPYGNIFQVIESDEWFNNKSKNTGGVYGAVIGVSDIEKSKKFYAEILGYDTVLWEGEGKFEDFGSLDNGGDTFKRCILKHSKPREGGFSQLLGETQIELVQNTTTTGQKIFKDRFWGDLGFIHLCFDINNMKALQAECEAFGHPFTVDSANSFDMGEAAGHFSYIEDPDGTLIEFVETHKIPIFKKIGWYLDLTKRDAGKPLPKWMLKSLSLNRKK
ncbi:MAG: VOC family protein [Bacteroidia bacterium]|nr:VOC family protein [Bacteroidia bacterium]NNJ54673.1 VOC family protein [Bacteroidia bacterium]